MNVAVTELTIDARGAEAGSAAYIRAMQAAQAAVDRLRDREGALATSQERQTAVMIASATSVSRAASSWDRLKASIDPAISSSRAIERATVAADNAMKLLGVSGDEAARVLQAVRLQHDDVAMAAKRQAEEYTRLAAAGREAFAANQNQQHINSVLGVREVVPGSARSSASVFEEAGREADQLAAKVATLRSQIDPVGTAQARLNAELAEYSVLAGRGAISVDELAAAQAMARSRFEATTDAIKRQQDAAAKGHSSFQSANIAAQFQDIGVTAAMGMSPMQIALQQGTQLSSVFEQMRADGQSAASGLAAAFTSVISPVSLLTIAVVGLTAYAIQYFTAVESESKKVESAIESHRNALEALAESQGKVTTAMEGSLKNSEAMLAAEERLTRAILERQSIEGQKALSSGLNSTGWLPNWMIDGGLGGATSVFEPFRAEIDRLNKRAQLGKATLEDFATFYEDVRRRASQDAGINPIFADRLITQTKEAELALMELDDRLHDLSSINPDTSKVQQGITDIGNAADKTIARINGLMVQGRAIGEMLEKMDVMFTDKAYKGDAVGGKGSMDRAQEEFNQLVDLWRRFGDDGAGGFDPDKPKKTPSGSKANPYRDLIKSADDRIAQMKLEADVAGMTGIAADTLRFKLDLLQKGEEKGRTLSPAQIAEIEKKAAAYEKYAEAAAGASLQQDLLFEREQMFRSPTEKRVHSELRSAGIDINSAAGQALASQIRLNEQLALGRDLALDFFGGMKDDLMDGVSFVEALGNAFERLGNRLLDMALNEAVNALFNNLGGGSASDDPWAGKRSTGSSGGGAGGGIFGFLGGLLGFAGGTDSAPPGLAWVGERGPELVNFRGGERVYDAQKSMAIAANQNGRAASGRAQIDVGISVDDDGKLVAFARQAAGEEADVRIKQYAAGSFNRHVSNNAAAKKRVRGF